MTGIIGAPLGSSLEKFLAHYGIKGMHWGVRRQPGADGTVEKTAAEPDSVTGHTSVDHERAAKAYAKAQGQGLQSLSNEELRAVKNRIEAEKSFRALTTDQKSELQKKVDDLKLMDEYRKYKSKDVEARRSTGRKLMDSMLKAGIDVASQHAADYGRQLVKDMLDGSKPNVKLKTPTSSTPKSGKKMPFKVNPNKVRINPTNVPNLNNLPKLKRP